MGRKDNRKYKYFTLQTLDPEGKPVTENIKVEHCHNRCLEATIDELIRKVALGEWQEPWVIDGKERSHPLFRYPSDRQDDPYLSALHRDAWNKLAWDRETMCLVTGEAVRLEITLWEIREEEYNYGRGGK